MQIFLKLYVCFISLETWDLKNPDEKYDILPEIWMGKNVADFIDPEIMQVTPIFCLIFFNLKYGFYTFEMLI